MRIANISENTICVEADGKQWIWPGRTADNDLDIIDVPAAIVHLVLVAPGVDGRLIIDEPETETETN